MCTWVIEQLQGILSPQPINVKMGALVCLQDTVPALNPTNPCLATIWRIIGGLAQAEPGYQIHHFIVIAQSQTYSPTRETEERSLISISTFYLDPDRPRITLSPPLIRQHHVSGTDLWACPLHKRWKKLDKTLEEGVPELNENQAMMGWVNNFSML